jgi:hypothetical protein
MTPSDDSFDFRKTSDKPPPEADYYVFADGKEQGPFALAGLCPLIRARIFPRSAQYRIDGISDWAPISELDDEVTVSMPRQHHYGFAYFVLPSLIFSDSGMIKLLTSSSAQTKLTAAWELAGKRVGRGDIVPPGGLAIELLPYGKRSELLLITLPTPRRQTEAYFIAVILPKANLFGSRTGTPRYFLLTHSGIFGENQPEGTLREITKTPTGWANARCEDFVDVLKSSFLTTLHKVCPE